MEKDMLEKLLQEQAEFYYQGVKILAGRIRELVVLPFCKKWNLCLATKPGDFDFMYRSGYPARKPERVKKEMRSEFISIMEMMNLTMIDGNVIGGEMKEVNRDDLCL